MQGVTVCARRLYLANVFKVHQCCSMNGFAMSFVWLFSVPLYKYCTVCSSVEEHWLVDFTLGWLWIMLLGTFMHKILGGHMLSVLTGISLGGELLGHVVPGFYYLNSCKTLSQITVPCSIPVSSAWGLQFLHILTNAYLSFGWGMSCGYERTGNPDWAVDFLHSWLFFTSVHVLHDLWKRLRKVKHIVAI